MALCSGECCSQSPGVRNGHSLVYFSPSRSLILFGGADEKKVHGDTWKFSEGQWEEITEQGPSPRTFPSMVTGDNYILLFGGNAVLFGGPSNPVHYLDDTWLFENNAWRQLITKEHPDARAEAAIAYDPVRQKVVLFGGRRSGEKWIDGDTWEFDGKGWSLKDTTGPTARSGAVMVYDSKLKGVILFGGNPVISKEKNYNGSMWLWNGTNWISMNSSAPLIFNSCMSYSTTEDFILRFGGWNGSNRVHDTWIYKSGNDWRKLHVKRHPSARNHAAMVFNPDKDCFFLYGGHDGDNVFGDMWEFTGRRWKLLFDVKPLRRIDNGH